MDEILNADDTMLAQLLLNDCIVSDGNTLFVDLSMATLVDQLSHTLQIWVPKNQNKLLFVIHLAQHWVPRMLWLAKGHFCFLLCCLFSIANLTLVVFCWILMNLTGSFTTEYSLMK